MGGSTSRDRRRGNSHVNTNNNNNNNISVVRQQQQHPPQQQPAYPYQYQQYQASNPPPQFRAGPGHPSPPPAAPRPQVAVQEGVTIKILATVEPTTVHYEPETQLLTFTVFSNATKELWYRVHTLVRETIVQNKVMYTPHTKRSEPAKFLIPTPCDNNEIALQLDLPGSTPDHLTYNKAKYPKFKPCVIEIMYNDEQGAMHSEHTSVDLFDPAIVAASSGSSSGSTRRRVIDQIVSTGGNCYVVESVFGGEHEELTIGEVAQSPGGHLAGGTSPTSGVVVGGVDDGDDDGLCVICLTEEKNTTVLPCKHMCVCKECAQQLMNHQPKCPVCRATITQLMSLAR